MNLPEPANYHEKVFFALGQAVLTASTDESAKVVTIHRQDAARACLAMAAVILSGKAEDAPAVTQAGVETLISASLKGTAAHLAKVMPGHALDAEVPGFTTRTLA